MSRSNTIDSLFFLQLILGAFFVIIGLEVILHYNSTAGQFESGVSRLFGNTDYAIQIAIAIVEIVCGGFLVLALVLPFKRGGFNFAVFVIFALWAFRIVYIYFVSRKVFDPTVLTWLKGFSLDLIVLVGVWATSKRFVNA